MKLIRLNLLKLSALLTILATNAAFGWQLGIANYTKAVVNLRIEYIACRDDNVTVQPGQIIHVDASWCLVDEITGTAEVNGKRLNLEKSRFELISGRDFSINIIEKGPNDAGKTYHIERVQ